MFTFQLRRGTAVQWAAANTVLRAGEPGLATDTKEFKVGDGNTPWLSLPLFVPSYLQKDVLEAYIAAAVDDAPPLSQEGLEQVVALVIDELDVPDLVVLYNNVKV